ncbi:MAG: hypothetical protein ACOCVF_00915 [bacterium]
MTNFKNTIEGRKFLNKVFYNKPLTYRKFIKDLDYDDVIPLIKCIDQDCEDWLVTEQLFHYFGSEICELLSEVNNLEDVSEETIYIIGKLQDCLKEKQPDL